MSRVGGATSPSDRTRWRPGTAAVGRDAGRPVDQPDLDRARASRRAANRPPNPEPMMATRWVMSRAGAVQPVAHACDAGDAERDPLSPLALFRPPDVAAERDRSLV